MFCWAGTVCAIWLGLFLAAAAGAERVREQLVVLYDFEEGAGSVVHDRSQAGQPLDLTLSTPGAARWGDGSLLIDGSVGLASTAPASKITDAVRTSGQLAIEAWVKPAGRDDKGPARIVSLSADPGQRNFTLGQEGSQYDVRLRAESTDQNGLPSLTAPAGSVTAELTHVVYTRDASGKATIYVGGKPVATKEVAGSLANWSGDFRLSLGNELTGNRPWHGELHLVAIYSRALSAEEIAANLAAGPAAKAIDYAALLPPAVGRKVDFVADVQPILKTHCYECHAQGNSEGGLDLGVRSRALEGGAHGPAIVRGKSAASRLIRLVAGAGMSEIDKDAIMPPKDYEPLTKEQVGILRAWIDQGVAWPKEADVPDPRLDQARTHWAFQPLRPVEPPSVKNAVWVRTPIDQFILAALEAKGLAPSPPVDAARLLRRVHYDVTGLPPSVEELEQYVNHTPSLRPSVSPSSEKEGESGRGGEGENSYSAVVDKLLASRHYGERWGRHWLDVARYADSDGYESDADRPQAYRYRDFVIQALHDDMPADQFLRWQLAGDELAPDDPQAAAATGFLTAAPSQFLEDKYLEEERLRNRYNELDDVLSTLGTGMLGLTLGCARCHDHKYDAISSREYYRLLSAVHSGDRKVVKLAGGEALVFHDFDGQPRPTWLFGRADFYDRDQPVQLGFLEVLSRDRAADDYWAAARAAGKQSDTTYQRAALATWLTDVEHGAGALAARVLVNRIWQHHFGEGLVRTVSDFGIRSQPPSHPELLEWLAYDLVTHGWKLKRLHRMILLSAVYQQAGRGGDRERGTGDRGAKSAPPSPEPRAPSPTAADPDDRLLWHKPPLRIEAEILRDAMLATSGTLNLEAFGPAFKPPIPSEALVARNTKSPYPADAKDDATTRRRSVYMFHKRVAPYPLLQAFDRPDAQQSCGRRENTTVAPQALALLNDEFVRARAADFAGRLLGEGGDNERLVARAFVIALSRQPTAEERSAAIAFVDSQTKQRHEREPKRPAAEIRQAAVADLCQAIYSLNEFVYID